MSEKTSFIVRIPEELHQSLKKQTSALHLSLNEPCCRRLSSSYLDFVSTSLLQQIDLLKRSFSSNDLAGILLYGSYARGEQTQTSDIDILLVLHPHVKLQRKLYEQVDALLGNQEKIEVHLSNLPLPEQQFSPLWAELALDGIVIYEQDFLLTRTLQRMRAVIAAGIYVRKNTHGQFYWTKTCKIEV